MGEGIISGYYGIGVRNCFRFFLSVDKLLNGLVPCAFSWRSLCEPLLCISCAAGSGGRQMIG